MSDRPLGKILHIIDGEAITHPDTSFVARGATVVTLDNKQIGKLGNPFGSVSRPFQPIILNNPDDESVVGKLVIAKISKKSRK